MLAVNREFLFIFRIGFCRPHELVVYAYRHIGTRNFAFCHFRIDECLAVGMLY